MEVCEVKWEISSVREAHGLKVKFHEQTEIRYISKVQLVVYYQCCVLIG